MAGEGNTVVQLVDGLRFTAGPDVWQLDPVRVEEGNWFAFVPAGADPVVDPSIFLARILATLAAPDRGVVELLGENVYQLDYGKRQRLRARIGFVHGYGGLLFNRTVRENIALPVSVHSRLSSAEEEQVVNRVLGDFSLEPVADLLPHEMDGATRWRVCLARSLVLRPSWLVLEGLGNWEMDRGRGVGWTRLRERQHGGQIATVICLSRNNPGFEAWFKEHDGVVVPYSRYRRAMRNEGNRQ